MRTPLPIEEIKVLGLDVYTREHPSGVITYCYYTNGKDIGYVQTDHGYSVTTVHKPCQKFGTGFRVDVFDSINKDMLEAGFALAPPWYRGSLEGIIKYKDWDSYWNHDSYRLKLIKK